MNSRVALEFIRRINSHDVGLMLELMTPDHRLVDPLGGSVSGKEALKSAWAGYFEMFPDYLIEVKTLIDGKEQAALFGTASGTHKGAPPSERWTIPAAWRAVVERNLVKVWQVYADTKVPKESMERTPNPEPEGVLGFGGVFFKAKDPQALARWYDQHLGTAFGEQAYHTFTWRERNRPGNIGRTEFSLFPLATGYFQPSEKPFMLNFRVRDLDALLAKLRQEGVRVEEKTETFDYGKFGWIIDPEGNKLELWEPADEGLEQP